jgi:hypothetical protein
MDVSSTITLSAACWCIDGLVFRDVPFASNPCSFTFLTPSTSAVAPRNSFRSVRSNVNEPAPCSQIRRALMTWKTKDFARAIRTEKAALGSARPLPATSLISCRINRCKISKCSHAVSSISAKPSAIDTSACDGLVVITEHLQSRKHTPPTRLTQ